MSQKATVNTFEKGMYQDAMPEVQPDGTYFYALNAAHQSDEFSNVLVNAESNVLYAKLPAPTVGGTYLDRRNATVYFCTDGGIYLVNHNEENPEPVLVMKDSEAECDWGFGNCEFIYGEFKTMQPCNEIHVYFSSDCEYYVVNIDEMLDKNRRECALNKGCGYFKLFRCICGPKISPIPVEGGGFLGAGAYQFAVQLVDEDGNTTNFFDITQPVYIGSDNNIGGEIGNWSIKVQIDQLEKGYTSMNVAVIQRVKGVVTVKLLPSLAYNSKSVTYEYYGDNPDAVPIDIAEVLIKGKKYLRGQDLMQKDGRLFLYGIRQDLLINYQQYASQIATEWVEFEVSAASMEKYHFPSLQRGENYALAIVFKFCDGTYSHAFHIPGNPLPSSNNDIEEAETIADGSISSGISDSPEGGQIKSTLGGVAYEPATSPYAGSFDEVEEFPYQEEFSGSTAWKNTGDANWLFGSGPTPGLQTGPDGPPEGLSSYAYLSSGKNLGKTATLTSPGFNLVDKNKSVLTFDYNLYGKDITTLELQATVDGENYYPIWSQSGNQGNVWQKAVVSLNNLNGSYAGFQFQAKAQGLQGDIGIGNFQIFSLSGATGGGIDPVVKPGAAGSDQYEDGVFDSSNTFNRSKGKPCDPSDLQNNSLTGTIESNIDGIDTQEGDAVQAIKEGSETINTPTVGQAWENDMSEISGSFQAAFNNLSEYADDNRDCPDVNTTSSIKESAKKLIQNGVINREYVVKGKTDWSFNKGGRYLGGGGPAAQGLPVSTGDQTPHGITGIPASIRGDQWVDAWGQDVIEESPKVLRTGKTGVYTSNIPYPDICDCDGKRIYPQGYITHHTMPDNSESTHYFTDAVGVIHKKDGTNTWWSDTFIRPLGLKFTNIYIPKDEELPKPLCPVSPFKIVMAKRDLNDRTILAKGIVTSCFTGKVQGREYAFPKHGVNSFECVDRFIEDGDSKIGVNSSPACYNFHSMDTNAQKIPITANKFKNYLELYGSGWRYGLYAKGKTPDKWYTDTRIDQRGARQAVSLGGQVTSLSESNIKGVHYAKANTVAVVPSIDLPLMNRYRESSVYFQLENKLNALQKGKRGPESDASFVGDVLDHSAPIKTAAAWYGAMYRDLPDQYGTVENMRYIDSGVNANIGHGQIAQGARTSIMGIMGDVFIGPHSFRRTGYVSNKVGETYPVKNGSDDGRQSEWKDDRSICDHAWDSNIEYTGVDHYPTKLPESGDVSDAKNWAGLHTTDIVYSAEGASKRTAPDSDYYYPKIQKTLVMYYGEFEVNPYFRQTGEGPQVVEGKVFYPKLKDLALDSSADVNHPWEESWLNRFYVRVEQPSLRTLNLKTMIRTFITTAMPMIAAGMSTAIESVPDSILSIVVFPALVAMWEYLNNNLFTDEWLNKMLGIPACHKDSEGGEDDECDKCATLVGFEDNYYRYSFDFSKRNDLQSFYGLPNNYNTCKCDNCQGNETTQEVYYSEKQSLVSMVDAYRNFKSNNFLQIPAHAGKLQKLFVEANRFYAHCQDGMYILQYNNAAFPSSVGNIILGRGDLLADPQLIMDRMPEGYAGLQDKNAAVSTSRGYFWVDEEGRGIFKLHGGQIDRISDKGMKSFFRESIPFFFPEECRDEKVSGVYYSLGYDHRNELLFVTKRDGNNCSSWTASYDMVGEKWVSFHSFIPMMYIWDRANMFSIKPGTGDIYLHNPRLGSYQTYYDSYQPFVLDMVARDPNREAFNYVSTILDTEAMVKSGYDYLRERHNTFTHIAMWSGTQSTGLHKIELRTDNPDMENDALAQSRDRKDKIEAVYANKQWRINELYDFMNNSKGQTTTKDCQGSPFLDLVDVDAKNIDIQNNLGKVMTQRYLFNRFALNDSALSKVKLYVKSVVTKVVQKMQ